jgi:hypothetical protein
MKLSREFHRVLRQRELTMDSATYENTQETAITILVQAGLQAEHMDEMGDEVSDNVQSLLMLAMLRSPELERTLFAAINDHIKARDEMEARINRKITTPKHRADLPHTCDTQHPDDPTPCKACNADDPLMLVCRDCGEAFDGIDTAHEHTIEGLKDFDHPGCAVDGFIIQTESEAM